MRVEDVLKKSIALLLLVTVLACRKEASLAADAGSVAPPPPAGVVEASTESRAPQELPRLVVRSAEMRVIVGDTTKAVEAIGAAAEASGGFVAGSRIWREGELLRATLTLRVPAEKLTPTLAAIRALSKRVDSESVSSEDVSAEFVDLGARLRNLEATETELRALLAVARERSKKASDVLEVHQQLTVIRGEIERTKGRMRYLSERSAMSSISLDLVPDAIAQPVVEPGWQPLVVARQAARALVGVLRASATGAIWALVYFVPLAGILLLAAGGLWLALRRRREA